MWFPSGYACVLLIFDSWYYTSRARQCRSYLWIIKGDFSMRWCLCYFFARDCWRDVLAASSSRPLVVRGAFQGKLGAVRGASACCRSYTPRRIVSYLRSITYSENALWPHCQTRAGALFGLATYHDVLQCAIYILGHINALLAFTLHKDLPLIWYTNLPCSKQ